MVLSAHIARRSWRADDADDADDDDDDYCHGSLRCLRKKDALPILIRMMMAMAAHIAHARRIPCHEYEDDDALGSSR
eukprot:12399171-Karenia_brevis.AAC.1